MTAPRAASLSTPILYAPGTALGLNATFPVDYDLADKWVSLEIRKTKTGSVLFRLDDGDSGVSISSQVASFSVEPDTVNAISGGPTLEDLANANSTLYFQMDLGADSDTDLTEYRIQGDVTVLEPGAFSESSSATSTTLSFESLQVAVTLAGQGADGAAGEGVPTGGTTGQILAKATGDNYDTEWITAAGTGDLLAANNLSDLDSAATARTNLGLGTAATSATGDFAPALGADDNYVTDAEKVVIGNTSGTNTGDQDLSGLQPKPAEGQFADGDKTKLDAIEASATADQTGAEIKAAYEAEANTNAFTDAEKTLLGNQSGTNTGDQDLSGLQPKPAEGQFVDGDKTKLDTIESGATADQTGGEIKSLYEGEADTNAFTDAEKTLLGNQSGTNTGDQDLSGYALTSSLGTAASLDVGTGANQIVQLNASSELPAVSGANLTNLPSGATQLSDLSDVGTTTATSGNVLVGNGSLFASRPLTESDISDFGTYLTDITGEALSDLDTTVTGAQLNTIKTTVDGLGTAASLDVGTSANQIVQLNGSAELPAVSGANLTNLPSGATQLSDLSDVGATTATNRNVLVADGDSWESRALTEADISDLGTYLTSVAAADISDATADGIALITSADANPFTDAEKTLLGNQSGTNSGDEIDATTSAKGIVELATDGESSAGVVVQGNDSRLSPPGQITIRINSPAVGVAGYTRIPKGLSIDSATIHASASCSAVVDLWVDSISTNPISDVTDADSITASAQPTLSSATYSTDATLTGWTTSLTEGDYIAANVDSVSGDPAWVEVILTTTPA